MVLKEDLGRMRLNISFILVCLRFKSLCIINEGNGVDLVMIDSFSGERDIECLLYEPFSLRYSFPSTSEASVFWYLSLCGMGTEFCFSYLVAEMSSLF